MNKDKLSGIKNEDFLQRYGIMIILLMVIVVNMIITPNFIHINTLWNAVLQSTSIIMLSMSMMLIIASGGIDISVGSMVALSSTIVVTTWHAGLGIASLFIAVIICGLIGVVSGFVIHKFKIQPLIVTLALMSTVRGAAQLITKGKVIQFTGSLTNLAYYRVFGLVPIQLFIIIAVCLIFYIISKKTKLGIYIESYGDNPKATRLAGIDTCLLLMCVYMFGGIMSGLAGILETMRLGAADASYLGLNMEIDAIAATAVGGTPMSGGKINFAGTIMGVVLMQIITMMVNMNNIPYQASLLIKAVIIVVALYFLNYRNTKKKVAVLEK